jgi:hypothetical protein
MRHRRWWVAGIVAAMSAAVAIGGSCKESAPGPVVRDEAGLDADGFPDAHKACSAPRYAPTRYKNDVFFFAVDLPEGYRARFMNRCSMEKSVGCLCTEETGPRVFLDDEESKDPAFIQVLSESCARQEDDEIIARTIDHASKDCAQPAIVKSKRIKLQSALGGRRAARVRVTCPASEGRRTVRETIMAFDPEGSCYSLTLMTDDARLRAHAELLAAMARSFRAGASCLGIDGDPRGCAPPPSTPQPASPRKQRKR